MAKSIHIGLLLIAVVGLCNAEEPTVADLQGSPESIELDGVMLTAVARPYINNFPTFKVPGQAVDCHGRFIVPVEIRTNTRSRQWLSELVADRMWVFQGDAVWSGPPMPHRSDPPEGVISIIARDCSSPIRSFEEIGGPLTDDNFQSLFDAAPRAITVIRFTYRGKSYLLRAPGVVVYSVS